MNKLFMLSMIALILVGCGQQHQTDVIIGKDGKDGDDGNDGYSIVAKSISNSSLCGSAGGTTVYLALDINRDLQFDDNDEVQTQYVACNGRNGLDGENGEDGQDGTSCTVNKVGNAATITCGNSSAVVVDGVKGDKGDKGDTGNTGATGPAGTNASGIYITGVINPCGVEFSNEEVFLRLSTGRILALYDGGANQDRLALIAPGNYITTDAVQNQSCSFTVTNDYQVTNQVRH